MSRKQGLAPIVKREYVYEDRAAGWSLRVKQHGIGWTANAELWLQGSLRPVKVKVGPALSFEELVRELRRLGGVALRAGKSLEKLTLKVPE